MKLDEPEPESPLESKQFLIMGEIGDAILATTPWSEQFSSTTFGPMPPAHDENDVPPVDPVWSPEAMLAFMYNRCQRRFGQAANESRRQLCAERLQLLRDVMTAFRSGDPATRLGGRACVGSWAAICRSLFEFK